MDEEPATTSDETPDGVMEGSQHRSVRMVTYGRLLTLAGVVATSVWLFNAPSGDLIFGSILLILLAVTLVGLVMWGLSASTGGERAAVGLLIAVLLVPGFVLVILAVWLILAGLSV